jgi:hypothetical protein
LVGLYYSSVNQSIRTFYRCTVSYSPFHTTLINCIVWTFGLAGTAINTFFSYFDRHNSRVCFWGINFADKFKVQK